MLCALTVRKLKPDASWEDLKKEFIPPEGVEAPAGWKRFYALQNVDDEKEVITFGFFDGSLEDLRAGQESGGDYEQRRDAVDQLVESKPVDGIFEVREDRSMD